jgi:anti-sigma regulatory factor (Ser/Thr protein kinase)
MTSELHVFGDGRTLTGAAGKAPLSRRTMLPATEQAPGMARQAAREALASWRLADLMDTAVLLISELVTNAVLHARNGGSGLVLHLAIHGSWLRIEVHDADLRAPRPRTPAGLDESGFGFVLVDSLADTWGVRETATGKAVWAEMDTRHARVPLAP